MTSAFAIYLLTIPFNLSVFIYSPSGKRAHRIPGIQNDRLCFKGFSLLIGKILLIEQDLENEFGEPGVIHNEITLVAPVFAPAVLDLPLYGDLFPSFSTRSTPVITIAWVIRLSP